MVVLTPADRAKWTARLSEAEDAYHSAMLGGVVKVVVDQNGERIEYSQASPTKLLSYISWLKNLLGDGCAEGPLNIWF